MARQRTSSKRRSRRTIGSTVRGVTPEKRRVRASRQTFVNLYFPRFNFNRWRDREAWRKNAPRLFAGALFVVMVVSLYAFFSSPAFYVDAVQFTGNRILETNELSQATNLSGWSVFFVDPREVENSLKNIPEVKDVRVTVSLPNVVTAEVVERLPRLVWETSGQTFWVDDDGIALRARANVPGILWLKDQEATPVKLGDRINPEAFNALVSLRNLWPTGPTVFEWERHHGLAAREEHGWLVYFGRSTQMPEKLAALKIVTAQIIKEGKPVNFIDLSSGLPYYQSAVVSNRSSVASNQSSVAGSQSTDSISGGVR